LQVERVLVIAPDSGGDETEGDEDVANTMGLFISSVGGGDDDDDDARSLREVLRLSLSSFLGDAPDDEDVR